MRVVPLGRLCDIRIGRTPSRANPDYWGGPHPWAAISDLTGGPLSTTREGITDLAVREARLRAVAPGTLLYSFKLTIGKVAVAATSLFTNEAIAALVPRDPDVLDSTYLRFALATIDSAAGSSVAVKGRTLNGDSLASLSIPMVSIDEQRRIAAGLTGELQAARSAEAAVIALEATVRELRGMAYAVAFSRPRQTQVRLGKVVTLIRGVTFNGDEASKVEGPALRA